MTACLRCGNPIYAETDGGVCPDCGLPPAAGPKVLVWRFETPKIEGWYWLRNTSSTGVPFIMQVQEMGDGLGWHGSGPIDDPEFEWAGPIPEPLDQEEPK